MYKSSSCSTLSPTFAVILFNFSHYCGYEMESLCDFNLHFLMTNEIVHLFICLLATQVFFCEVSIQAFHPFFTGLFFFFLLICSSSHILDVSPWLYICTVNISAHISQEQRYSPI